MAPVDRRDFLARAGVAGAAAGGLWLAPSVLGSSTAWAGTSCLQTGTLVWSNVSSGTAGYPFAPITNGQRQFTVAAANVLGSHAAVNVRITVNPIGTPSAGSGTPANGGIDATVPYPNNPAPAGMDGITSYYALNMQNAGGGAGYSLKIEFLLASNGTPVNVYNLQYTLIDIDRATSGNQYKDNVWIDQTAGAPTFSASAGSNVTGSGTLASPWTSTGTAGVQNSTGNVAITYTGASGISTTTFRYTGGEGRNGIQYTGIGNLTWCY